MEDLRAILASTKTIAVVGLSNNPDRPSHRVAAYLQNAGYTIIPVHPAISSVLGVQAYPNLRAIPHRPDVVQIFRKSSEVPPIVEDAIAIGAQVVWMQKGIVNETAAARARAAGLKVVMDTCMMDEHRALRAKGSL